MTATIDDALALVVARFRGLTDKDGQPYVLHCLRVMLDVQGPLAQQVAVMHDLVEDTDVTIADLQQLGFAEEVVSGVRLLTHLPSDSYAEYVVRLKSDPLARQVKLADLRDNYSLQRVAFREHKAAEDLRRIQRYMLSYQFLLDHIDEANYRQRMSGVEDA